MKKKKILGIIAGVSTVVAGVVTGKKVLDKRKECRNLKSKDEVFEELEARILAQAASIIERDEIHKGSVEDNVNYVLNHYDIEAELIEKEN